MFVHKVVLENTVKFISHAAHCKLFIKKNFPWGKKMLLFLSLDFICSLKLTFLLELDI